MATYTQSANRPTTMSVIEQKIIKCGEQQIDCVRCKSQAECQKEWDRFIDAATNGNEIIMPKRWAKFEQRLERFQQLNSIAGVFCFSSAIVLFTSYFWGSLIGI